MAASLPLKRAKHREAFVRAAQRAAAADARLDEVDVITTAATHQVAAKGTRRDGDLRSQGCCAWLPIPDGTRPPACCNNRDGDAKTHLQLFTHCDATETMDVTRWKKRTTARTSEDSSGQLVQF